MPELQVNLLKNPSFDDPNPPTGQHLLPPGISGVLPAEWILLEWTTSQTPKQPSQFDNFAEPEILPITYQIQFPELRLLHDQSKNPDGSIAHPRILKAFKDHAPTGLHLYQTIQLTLGHKYRFTVPLNPDHYLGPDQYKHDGIVIGDVRPSITTSPDWYLASQSKLFLIVEGEPSLDTGWIDARTTPFGQYSSLFIEFTANKTVLAKIGFGLLGIWGCKNNGWFVDDCTLYDITDDSTVPPVIPPVVPPIVPPTDLEKEIAQANIRLAAVEQRESEVILALTLIGQTIEALGTSINKLVGDLNKNG